MKKIVSLLFSFFLIPFCFAALISISENSLAEDEIIVTVSDEEDITIEHFPSSGKYLMIWLAPEYGIRPAHRSLAKMLSKQNIEVWLSNIVESLFLPQSSQSIKQLDGKYVADLIESAHKLTGKKIIVAGDSYAALSALSGAHQWQQRKNTESYFIGAVLFSPYTYAYIPPLGLSPEFMPIVSATNIPIMIYQAKGSASIGQFNLLLEKLQQHDNPVYTKFMPDIMGLFYKEEPTIEMKNNVKLLPRNIKKMISVLEKYNVPSKPIPLKRLADNKSGTDIFLKEFKGHNTPMAIKLTDAYGNTVIRDDYKGKVTLVNFWATWCPPCVQEIPSLNRLKQKMSGLAFELISINYAEDNKTILDFMKKINVEFPVLMDQDGNFAKKWNVITYPSTFVIDKNGKIIYGVNAAIEWDDPEFIEKIKSLL